MTVKKRKDNFFLPHVWAFIVLRLKWITYIPNRIYLRINRWGWRLVFWLMLNVSKNLEKSLKPIEKYFVFRNWSWNQVIKWMTVHEGWVMSVTRPKAKRLRDRWATIAFHNPKYLDVNYKTADDGSRIIESIGFFSSAHDYLVLNWHPTHEQVENMKHQGPEWVNETIEELMNEQ